MREKVQSFGRFLSGMVMPNIAAFIAWGFLTALFIATGWFPNEKLATIVSPMLQYLLPILIAYTGGKLVHGTRGGVVGAIAAIGIVSGTTTPMLMGAMIVGPLGAYLIKLFDKAIKGKIPAGFEMLVNNFSAGILGLLLIVLGYYGIGPMVLAITNFLVDGVKIFVNVGALPLVSLLVEPAKVLFLNNAINHGVFSTLGIEQVAQAGKSIFFLIETNPGPGLGILLACFFFGKGAARDNAPSAMIIHFLGGIHEIYFPYVLMNPLLILAVMAGGVVGVFTFGLLGAGLVASPSPGSILALISMAPKGGLLPVLVGVVLSAAVSFVVAALIYRFTTTKGNLDEAKDKVAAMKASSKGLSDTAIKKIVFACDAGMGSSAMGATTLKRKFQQANIIIEIAHSSIEDIPDDAQLIVTQNTLKTRAQQKAGAREVIGIDNFIGAPEYDQLVERFKH